MSVCWDLGESYSGMWSQATFDAQENLNEGDRLQRPQHEHIMSLLCLDASLALEASTAITFLCSDL